MAAPKKPAKKPTAPHPQKNWGLKTGPSKPSGEKSETKITMEKTMKEFYRDSLQYMTDATTAYFKALGNFSKGMEHLKSTALHFSQEMTEAYLASLQSFADCKTTQELVDLNGDLTRKNLSKVISEGSKLSEMSINVANETMEPLNTHLTKTVEKIFKQKAA